jgi:hypothetical protein
MKLLYLAGIILIACGKKEYSRHLCHSVLEFAPDRAEKPGQEFLGKLVVE